MNKIDENQINEWFTHHPPTNFVQMNRYEDLREAARIFAHCMLRLTSPSADQSAAFRHLRECVMTANASIALENAGNAQKQMATGRTQLGGHYTIPVQDWSADTAWPHLYDVTDVAKICHENTRQLCITNGEVPLPPWNEAEQWARDSSVSGVLFRLANLDAPPSVQHEQWMAERLAAGWVYGPVRDVDAKINPCLVRYDELPASQKAKDYLFVATVRALAPMVFMRDEGSKEEDGRNVSYEAAANAPLYKSAQNDIVGEGQVPQVAETGLEGGHTLMSKAEQDKVAAMTAPEMDDGPDMAQG